MSCPRDLQGHKMLKVFKAERILGGCWCLANGTAQVRDFASPWCHPSPSEQTWSHLSHLNGHILPCQAVMHVTFKSQCQRKWPLSIGSWAISSTTMLCGKGHSHWTFIQITSKFNGSHKLLLHTSRRRVHPVAVRPCSLSLAFWIPELGDELQAHPSQRWRTMWLNQSDVTGAVHCTVMKVRTSESPSLFANWCRRQRLLEEYSIRHSVANTGYLK